jgi:hypothetical protein
MKKLTLLAVFGLVLILSSCGKKDEKVNTENQSSTQNIAPGVNNKWLGQYSFDESAKNVTGEGSQTWGYVITVKENANKNLIAEINIDGFQTTTRIEADVKPNDKSADFIFSKYLPENMFELYKKGDKLFSFEMNGKGELVTNWDKMKPNVIDNQKSGSIMFKRISL